ncbi:Aminotransferase, class IV [Moelleriella libera RCEF 2490]|uniref:Aminotransferase, class IV n=1 Tax=Moelleriella libera RCEF 2490 TaxID=1081109 RepID=A0A168FBE8_9HYPO|nr:Aminotransferase, class IV [Moelleriella libera RCEF 2490]
MGLGPRRRRLATPSHRVLRSHSRREQAPSPSPSSDYMERLSPRQVREIRRDLVQRLREKMEEQCQKRKELQEVQEEVAEMRRAVQEQEENRAQQEAPPPGPGPAGQGQGQSDPQVVVRRRSPRLQQRQQQQQQQQQQRMPRPRPQLSRLPTITEEEIVVAVQEEQRQGKNRRRRRSRLQREKKSGSRLPATPLPTPTRTEDQITVLGPLPPPSPPRYELTTFFRFSVGLPEECTRFYHKGILDHCYLFGYALRSLMTAARELMWLPIPHFLIWRGATTRLMFLIEQSVRREHRLALVNPYKNFIIRLALERDGTIGVTARLITERNHACFWPSMLLSPRVSLELAAPVPVYIDTMPTPFSLHLRHCTSNKTILNASRARVGLKDVGSREADVLLYDHAGMVCGTPSATVYFFREGQYYTPDISTGCLAGASFAWAMERSLARQAFIPLDQICEGEKVWLSNAVNGFYRGIIARRHEVAGP